jgi:hypothetical protein
MEVETELGDYFLAFLFLTVPLKLCIASSQTHEEKCVS